jgi:hypothetical protein
MDQLVIPQGCVIQGEKLSIRHEGDIVIRSQMSLLSIKSLRGNLHYAPPGDQNACAHLGAEEGELRLETRSFQGDLLTGRTLVLNCGKMMLSQAMQASESLLLEGESLEVPECRGGELVIHLSGPAQAQTIEAEGPLELVFHSGTVGHIRARRVVISCAGRFEADRITATEGVEIRSGHITVKMVDAPTFQAAPSVRGIVMLSTAEDVRAEGVRGFILPTEFKMLSEQSGLLALASSSEPAPSLRNSAAPSQTAPMRSPAREEQLPPASERAGSPAANTPAELAVDDLELPALEDEEPAQTEGLDAQLMDSYRIDTADLSYLEQVESGHLPEPSDVEDLDLEAVPAAWQVDGESAPAYGDEQKGSAEPAAFGLAEGADLAWTPELLDEPDSMDPYPAPPSAAPSGAAPSGAAPSGEPSSASSDEEAMLAVDFPEPVFPAAETLPPEPHDLQSQAENGELVAKQDQASADEFALDFSVSGEQEGSEAGHSEPFDQSFYTMAMPAFTPGEPSGEHISQPLPESDFPAAFAEEDQLADPPSPAEVETGSSEEDAAMLPMVDSFDDADLGAELPPAPALDAFDSAELVPEPLLDSSFASPELEELEPAVNIADFPDPEGPLSASPAPPPVPPPVPPPFSPMGGAPVNPMPGEPSQDEEEVPSPSQAQLRKEDLLVDLLSNIMDDIKSHFPDDNYPKFISQIETYLLERRFSILRKARNREAVLSSFDRLDHPEISKLARLFYKQMANFFGDEM